MDTDPFENFGEQMQSFELIEEHRTVLLDDAREFRREHPELEVVGMILDPDASEARRLREAIEQATGQSLGGRGFVGVAPREYLLQILRADAPATLDWLPASTHDERHWLPVAAFTKKGVRFAALQID